jgi:hypothetical protein
MYLFTIIINFINIILDLNGSFILFFMQHDHFNFNSLFDFLMLTKF